jgi:hypothetical protein
MYVNVDIYIIVKEILSNTTKKTLQLAKKNSNFLYI